MPHIIRRLEEEYAKVDAPILSFIAVSTGDPYRVLAGCILSLRTLDSTTAEAAARLFDVAPNIEALAKSDPKKIEKLIYPVGFYKTKAPRLVEMAKKIVDEYDGIVPDDIDELLTLNGVGRKTANLVVTIGYQKPGICVDTHVHRISNRWGYVDTPTPDKTEFALRQKLPAKYWIRFNDLLVSFGQTVCRPTSPRCSECVIAKWCPRLEVTTSR